MQFITDTGQSVVLSDRQFLASGGEADIYVNGNTAFRIHHTKINIPKQKLIELKTIRDSNVVKPLDLLFDSNHKLVGFTMNYVKSTEPLCKYFTLTFKKQNNISQKQTVELIKNIQNTVSSIHNQNFLIVDLNELNVLIGQDHVSPYFIDVGSWQTPSFPATAIMDSIRDPLVKNNQFNEGSDWFSYAILAFQLYIGIHPYKGKHPNYQPNEWGKRMRDGISVFDSKSSLPSVCLPINSIPSRHLNWFKEVFTKNLRNDPPLPDLVVPIPIPKQIIIKSTGKFEVKEIFLAIEDILDVQIILGNEFLITKNKLITKVKDYSLERFKNRKKISVCGVENSNEIVFAVDFGDKVCFFTQDEIGNSISNGFFYRNDCIYTCSGGSLIQNSFVKFGNKIIHKTLILDNVSEFSAKIYDGLVVQNLLGKIWLTIPYDKGKSKNIKLKELDGFRIIEAKSISNFVVIVCEKGGIFYRFIIVFNQDFDSYSVRIVPDIPFMDINFAILDNGICVLVSGDDEIEIFRDNTKYNCVKNIPFDNETKLFNNGGLRFISNNSIFSVKMK